MCKSIAINGLAAAGLWIFSFFAASSVLASELKIPAPLQNDEARIAPLYKPVTPQQVKVPVVSNWAEVNQRVHEIGGWMFYAAEGAIDHKLHKQTKQPDPKTNSHESQ